ncbi:ABC transporter ATP-binding protein [Collinsella sp. AGMB00827]|uniref:ABC transporter ATP-binding protein n=2 Tax=Collinsella ureilytica TaxID=2869515 RepID=A0ABS7MKW8_9ACTN|nr:ABC transporter ATP-binding protein [Collinsella urealyticum]
MTQTLLSIVYVANLVIVFTRASASATRVVEVLDCEPSIVSPVNGVDVGEATGEIELTAARDIERGSESDQATKGNASTQDTVPAERVAPVSDAVSVEHVEPAQRTVSVASSAARQVAPSAARQVAPHAAPQAAPPAEHFAAASEQLAPALRFSHVSFSFGQASTPALDDISLELAQGQTLGIIGGTGSGKSLLVSLLPRLYDVDSGSVEVLGADVHTWNLQALRRAIGLVPQGSSLISGTIRSNLLWRDAQATDDELWNVLETAQAAEFVQKLPLGLDAPVEAGGRNFSGGQRQRLTIARALVGRPRMLILDDAASALDLKTDAELRRAIHHRTGQAAVAGEPLSTVIVSQRVSSVREANLICVMRRGRTVGLGTHDELLATCEVYREICSSQGIALPEPSERGEA